MVGGHVWTPVVKAFRAAHLTQARVVPRGLCVPRGTLGECLVVRLRVPQVGAQQPLWPMAPRLGSPDKGRLDPCGDTYGQPAHDVDSGVGCGQRRGSNPLWEQPRGGAEQGWWSPRGRRMVTIPPRGGRTGAAWTEAERRGSSLGDGHRCYCLGGGLCQCR